MRRSFERILFDLDGTLIDHFEAIHEAYRFAQESLGLPPADYEKVRRTVGGSVPVTMRRLVGEEAPDETVDRALALFDQRFSEIMLGRVTVLPGIREWLPELAREAVPLAVFTNKKGPHARAVLAHLGLDRFFDFVVGAGDTPFRKPQPEFTDHVLALTGARPERTLLVGDSPFDVEAARTRRLPMAAVATGSHAADELREAGADWTFPDANALRAWWRGGADSPAEAPSGLPDGGA